MTAGVSATPARPGSTASTCRGSGSPGQSSERQLLVRFRLVRDRAARISWKVGAAGTSPSGWRTAGKGAPP